MWPSLQKSSMLACKFWPIFQGLKSHNSVNSSIESYKSWLINSQMIQVHFGIKQSKIGKRIGVLCIFVWNYVNYANMESFCRDSHILYLKHHAYETSWIRNLMKSTKTWLQQKLKTIQYSINSYTTTNTPYN